MASAFELENHHDQPGKPICFGRVDVLNHYGAASSLTGETRWWTGFPDLWRPYHAPNQRLSLLPKPRLKHSYDWAVAADSRQTLTACFLFESADKLVRSS
jgi:hypothetical protein